jgi:hypothetical protein
MAIRILRTLQACFLPSIIGVSLGFAAISASAAKRGEARPRERLLADSGWRFHLELPMSTTSYS